MGHFPITYTDIQKGMTRAKRYANHAGGRKYDKTTGAELAKSSTHKDASEKLEASDIFRAIWQQCKEHEGYQRRKEVFVKEQKEWDKMHKVTAGEERPRRSGREKSKKSKDDDG